MFHNKNLKDKIKEGQRTLIDLNIAAITVFSVSCGAGVLAQPPPLPPPLRIASVYGDHMVLQQAPARAIIWGYVTECDSELTATFAGSAIVPTMSMGV